MKILSEIDSFERVNKSNLKVGDFICKDNRIYLICKISEIKYHYKYIGSVNAVTGNFRINNFETDTYNYNAIYDWAFLEYRVIPEKYYAFINKFLVFG